VRNGRFTAQKWLVASLLPDLLVTKSDLSRPNVEARATELLPARVREMGDLRLVAASKILSREVGVDPVGRGCRLRTALRRRTIGMVELRTGTMHPGDTQCSGGGLRSRASLRRAAQSTDVPAALAAPGPTYCRFRYHRDSP
jgi:hypothetical protein